MSNADIRGRFIWHELMTTDTDGAAAFYSKVVPWKTQDSGMPSYTLWMVGKTQVGGLTGLSPDGSEAGAPPHWIVYIATSDVDGTVAEAQRLGGKVLKSATDIPNMGRYAVLSDPQGAAFAVYTPPGPLPEGAGASGGAGEFGWHELATTDYAAALNFYTQLFGWEKGPGHDMGAMGVYQLINHRGAQVGGAYNLQAPSTPPHWLSYVRVPDCTKATAAAKAAGGRVLHGPVEVPGGSWVTMLMDPQGGAFAVLEPPKTQAQKPGKAEAPKAKAAAPKPVAANKAAEKPKAAAKADAPAAVSTPEPAAAPAKKAARKAAKKGKAKSGVRRAGAAKRTAPRKTAGKKTPRKAAGKRTSAKRGKSVARKSVAKRAAKKAKRR